MPEPSPKEKGVLDLALSKLTAAIDRSKDPAYNGTVSLEIGVVDGQLRSFTVGQEEKIRR